MGYFLNYSEIIRCSTTHILWEDEGELVCVEPYGPSIIRVRATHSLHLDDECWNLLQPAKTDSRLVIGESYREIHNGNIIVRMGLNGELEFFDQNYRSLLSESWMDRRNNMSELRRARMYKAKSSHTFETDVYFNPDPTEAFYGLGQEANDHLNLKGLTVELCQKNGKCSIPYVMSSKGYGFIWNNPAIGRVELTNNGTRWHANSCKQVDYLVFCGSAPDEINSSLLSLTGFPSRLPDWALGFWQSRLRYTSQEEVLSVAREYAQRKVPVSVMVIDYFHWPLQGTWTFDHKYWPNPTEMVQQLNDLGIEVIVSIWPTVDPRSDLHDHMRERNMLLKSERGIPIFFMIMGPQKIVDATHPSTGPFWWEQVKANYYEHGIKNFWLDETEPEMRPYDYENVRMYLGNGEEVSNIYPYYYAKCFADGQRNEGKKDFVNLVRCSWLGSQTQNIIMWSGDIPSSFDSLRRQIKAGLNFCLCGIPWWTTDIGGFFGGDPGDQSFRELLVRWFQFGVFSPIMRLHGKRLPYDTVNKQREFDAFLPSCGENELWSYGEEVYKILESLVHLRETLRSYISGEMEITVTKGTPIMRPLFYDFPKDLLLRDIGDEFLFGSDILVAPIVEYASRSRQVYFPKGSTWYCPKSEKFIDGGITIQAIAELHEIPVFIKKGSSLFGVKDFILALDKMYMKRSVE